MKIYNLNKLVSAPSISSIYFNREDYQDIKILPRHEDTHNSNEKLMKCWDKQNWQKIFGSESQYQVEIGHQISQLSECMTSAVKTYIQSRNFPIKYHYLLKVLKVLMYEPAWKAWGCESCLTRLRQAYWALLGPSWSFLLLLGPSGRYLALP